MLILVLLLTVNAMVINKRNRLLVSFVFAAEFSTLVYSPNKDFFYVNRYTHTKERLNSGFKVPFLKDTEIFCPFFNIIIGRLMSTAGHRLQP